MKRWAVMAGVLWALAACSSEDGASGADGVDAAPDGAADVAEVSGDSTSDDVSDGAVVDVAEVSGDSAGDASPTDAAGDAASDVEPDAGCEAGARRCSEDARTLEVCEDGAWVATDCGAGDYALCEDGACVPAARWGAPVWGTCPDEPLGTEEGLAEKAAYYDDIAARLHVHPELKWITNVDLARVGGAPAVDEAEATWEDVERWHTGENDGLWSALYLTSQAYRYAVTESDEALANIRLLLEGQVERMEITGVPGVFTRQLIPPGVDGIACPEDEAEYTTDVEKDDNQWVRVGDDGCAEVIPHETGEWTTTDHCISQEYAGYCWLDNVSQDEYGGHMLALSALARLVDVPDVQETVRDLSEQVAVHLMENDLAFVDWDGRVTEHGKLWATSFANTPGFLAAESLGWVKLGLTMTGRADLEDFYRGCLLQEDDRGKCLDHPFEDDTPYTEYLPEMGLYAGPEGCKSNFNTLSMAMSALQILIGFADDPEVRGLAQQVLDEELVNHSTARAIHTHENTWYDFIWAAYKPLGPGTDGHATAAVERAICGLRQFPASQAQAAQDSASLYPHYCDGRLDGRSEAEHPIPPAQRCTETFLWWNGTYTRHACDDAPWRVHQPGDYLLPYWMGRHYGFISEEL